MNKAVSAYLVATSDNLGRQAGPARDLLADEEECRFHLMPLQRVKNGRSTARMGPVIEREGHDRAVRQPVVDVEDSTARRGYGSARRQAGDERGARQGEG